MKTRLTSITLMLALLLLAPLNFASAMSKDDGGVSVPVTGTFADPDGTGIGKFTGTLNIQRFAAQDGHLVAVGTISGTLADSDGNVIRSGVQTVSLPVTATSGDTAAAPARKTENVRSFTFTKASFDSAAAAEPAAPAQRSCQILRLSIGRITLNLLGLVVDLSPVLLVISAVPGAGNLLGNLLCAIAGLLDGTGSTLTLIQLLNQLLALLG